MRKKLLLTGATVVFVATLIVVIKKKLGKKEIFFAINDNIKQATLHFNYPNGCFDIEAVPDGFYFIPKKEGALFLVYEGITNDGEHFTEKYVFQNDNKLNPATYYLNDNDELEAF